MSVKLNRIKRYYLYLGLDLYGICDSMEECERMIVERFECHPGNFGSKSARDEYFAKWEVREATSFSM